MQTTAKRKRSNYLPSSPVYVGPVYRDPRVAAMAAATLVARKWLSGNQVSVVNKPRRDGKPRFLVLAWFWKLNEVIKADKLLYKLELR